VDKTQPAFRLKFAADQATGEIAGYGSVIGNVDSAGERVMRGAFAGSLARHRAAGTTVKMLWQHYSDMPIGNWTDLREDETGLFLRGKVNRETSWGKDAWAAITDGNVDGLSIGYREIKATPDGVFRNLDELELLEVSVVTFPANPLARLTSKAELADLLTKAGLSRAAAAKVAAGGYPALAGETDDPDEIDALIRAVKLSTDRLRRA
jgi:HK97 family phage prohead protease